MRVLITGASGFVGVNLVRRFAEAGADVLGLVQQPVDAIVQAFTASHGSKIRWVLGDVTDRSEIASLLKRELVDVVVHAAAVTFTQAQEHSAPASVFDINAVGTLNMLEASRQANVSRFVYISSGGLYGSAPPQPALSEEVPLKISNLYGVAKLASEHLCLQYARLARFDVCIGRLGTAYGPMERMTEARSQLSAIYQAVSAAMKGGQRPLLVAGADIARDFCHINDVADAYWRLSVTPEIGGARVFNIGASKATPLRTALDTLTQEVPGFEWRMVQAGETAAVQQVPLQARAGMDLSRIKIKIGWWPQYDLAAGVRAYVGWWSSHWLG